jgi:hypothetical protein
MNGRERSMATTAGNLDKIDAQLERWGEKIDKLVTLAEGVGARAALNHRERIMELKAKRAAATARLVELRAESSSRWRRSRGGIATAWNDLMIAFRALEREAGG